MIVSIGLPQSMALLPDTNKRYLSLSVARAHSGLFFWFSLNHGSLWEIVLFVLWLANGDGSLLTVARLPRWFSNFYGSLFDMVPLGCWLANFHGSLKILARFL